MLRLLALASLSVVPLANAQDDGELGWITQGGVEGYAWESDSMPFDAVPRPRDFVLPDSSFIGANKQDRPEDLEIKAPPGERRFLRYARGQLVDAWWVRTGKLDPGPLVETAKADWTGVVLGPAEDGFLAYGVATSWTVGARTVLHWRDRLGSVQVIASRAAPTLQYGIGRPTPLEKPGDTGSRPTLKGDFRKEARPFVGAVSSCFDTSPKPVGATIELRLDARGQPSRIKVAADQPAFNLEDCVAAALMDLKGAPNAAGKLELLRFQ
ncbi:MAG: hypothetical protein Q8P18_30980 [Pseudomonadota bacterium]|nr:hypothetical protein [Pseudomonadota bacterium]